MNPYPHLLATAFRMRQAMAAGALRDCVHVLEIGGAVTSIEPYLPTWTDLTVVDPLADDFERQDETQLIRYLKAKVEEYQGTGNEDGLCMLGFEGFRHIDRSCIEKWTRRVKRIVLEAARSHPPAQESIEEILRWPWLRATTHISMHCRGTDIPQNCRRHAREFYILETK